MAEFTLTTFTADLALRIGPAEYFFLLLLIFLVVALCSTDAWLKALAAVCTSLLLASVGTDINSGIDRFMFDSPWLTNGIDASLMLVAFVLLPRVLVPQEPRTWLARALERKLPHRIWLQVSLLWRCALAILAVLLLFEIEATGAPMGMWILLTGLTICGVWFYWLEIPSVLLYVAFAYGGMVEENLRRALLLSRGDLLVVLQRPVVTILLSLMALALLIYYLRHRYRTIRVTAPQP